MTPRMQIVVQVDGETVGGPIDDIALDGPEDAGFLIERLRYTADRIETWKAFRELVPKEGFDV